MRNCADRRRWRGPSTLRSMEISPGEIKAKYDHLNTDDVLGGVYLAKDGQGDPANIALALAKGRAKERRDDPRGRDR